MYSKEEREVALDLWFEMSPKMRSLERFVEELGWPSRTCMMNWIMKDPRFDPDKFSGRSAPMVDKLDAIRRVSEGSSIRQAAKATSISASEVVNLVNRYAEGGTAALLPKRKATRMGKEKPEPEKEPGRMPCAGPPSIPDELPDDTVALKAMVSELRLDNAILREVLDVLKADPGCEPSALTNREKTVVVANLTSRFTATAACARLGLARSTYYYETAALARPDTRNLIAEDVIDIFNNDGEGARGYRFVHERLVSRSGGAVSEKIVRDVMREHGLHVVYRKAARRYSSYTGEIDEAPANLLLRADGTHDFHASAPWVQWVSDITEFKVGAAKIYLSPVVDLYDGKPISWSISTRPDADLANSALSKACMSMPKGAHPGIHTDRGCHYRWPGWKSICAEFGLTRSMSRKGRSPDNAACEGFFGRLKNEFYYGRDWSGIDVSTFISLLDAWMIRYSSIRLKAFREEGRTVYDTINGHRKRLGMVA